MKQVEKIILFLFFSVLTFLCHKDYLFDFPNCTHAWAQADRFAITKGFVENNLNFFSPQTKLYNHQFPDNWKKDNKSRITSVDFPIHDYIPAMIMKITGKDSPVINRLYVLILGYLGLFYLYKIARLMGLNFYSSFLIMTFTATIPVFVFYNSNFLPSVPSFSLSVIGIYHFMKYYTLNNLKYFILSITFLTFAALARTTFLIPLCVILFIDLIHQIRSNSFENFYKKIGIGLLGFGFIISYYLYNLHLRNLYGSLFLNSLTPAKNVSEFFQIIYSMKENWLFEYFSIYHYLLIISIILIALLLFKKIIVKPKLIVFFSLSFVLLIGEFLFFIVMSKQFVNHDYYFIDTFLLPILLLIVCLFIFVEPFLIRYKRIQILSTFLVSGFLLFSANKSQFNRRENAFYDVYHQSTLDYKNAKAFLKRNKVLEKDKILVLSCYGPNIPFLLMDKSGFCNVISDKQTLTESLKFPAKYIVFQNAHFMKDIYKNYPEIIKELKVIATNGLITLCKREKSQQNLDEFFNLNRLHPTLSKSYCKKISLKANTEFFDLFKLRVNNILSENHLLKVHITLSNEQKKECFLVVTSTEDENNRFYEAQKLSSNDGITDYSFQFSLPSLNGRSNELKVYLWNSNHVKLELNKMELKLY